MNIKNDFLYGDLQEEVYIKQSPKYIVQEKNATCKIKKVIYGFKQSSRARFKKFSIVIASIGFQHYHYDHSVFSRHTHSDIILFAIYADDILLNGSDISCLTEINGYLK